MMGIPVPWFHIILILMATRAFKEFTEKPKEKEEEIKVETNVIDEYREALIEIQGKFNTKEKGEFIDEILKLMREKPEALEKLKGFGIKFAEPALMLNMDFEELSLLILMLDKPDMMDKLKQEAQKSIEEETKFEEEPIKDRSLISIVLAIIIYPFLIFILGQLAILVFNNLAAVSQFLNIGWDDIPVPELFGGAEQTGGAGGGPGAGGPDTAEEVPGAAEPVSAPAGGQEAADSGSAATGAEDQSAMGAGDEAGAVEEPVVVGPGEDVPVGVEQEYEDYFDQDYDSLPPSDQEVFRSQVRDDYPYMSDAQIDDYLRQNLFGDGSPDSNQFQYRSDEEQKFIIQEFPHDQLSGDLPPEVVFGEKVPVPASLEGDQAPLAIAVQKKLPDVIKMAVGAMMTLSFSVVIMSYTYAMLRKLWRLPEEKYKAWASFVEKNFGAGDLSLEDKKKIDIIEKNAKKIKYLAWLVLSPILIFGFMFSFIGVILVFVSVSSSLVGLDVVSPTPDSLSGKEVSIDFSKLEPGDVDGREMGILTLLYSSASFILLGLAGGILYYLFHNIPFARAYYYAKDKMNPKKAPGEDELN